MPRIEDYALIGDTHSAALVSIGGSIDWLCFPRFDSDACLAALLDEQRGGHWLLAPAREGYSTSRSYLGESLVMTTTFETNDDAVEVIDCMPLSAEDPGDPRSISPASAVLRVVKGLRGTTEMTMELRTRFDYGRSIPWIHEEDDVLEAAVGPHALDVSATVDLTVDGTDIRASFEVSEGEAVAFLCRYRSSESPIRAKPAPDDWSSLLDETTRFWESWASQCGYEGQWREQVIRSLLTMKAMTYSSTGALIAAVTTSLPENIGGTRNWDYRYCWLRDATLALEVLIDNGYLAEAREFHDWLLRALGGDADQIQVMYAATGERRLPEMELDWLRGYERSAPVRVGNAATEQFQLDVCGEVMDLFHTARGAGIDPERAWPMQSDMAELVCTRWAEPDNGIWEIRSSLRQHVHSKAMAWVALDRAIKAVSDHGKEGDIERWRKTRDEIRAQVLRKGVDRHRGCFTMSYGTSEVDASLLRLPLVGFIDARDDVMAATIQAIEDDLVVDGLVRRYRTERLNDGMDEPEGAFFLCTFWLVGCYVLSGREAKARETFTRALSHANDVGLLSEQYDTTLQRQVGNFPQAFSHFSLVTAALGLELGSKAPGLSRGR